MGRYVVSTGGGTMGAHVVVFVVVHVDRSTPVSTPIYCRCRRRPRSSSESLRCVFSAYGMITAWSVLHSVDGKTHNFGLCKPCETDTGYRDGVHGIRERPLTGLARPRTVGGPGVAIAPIARRSAPAPAQHACLCREASALPCSPHALSSLAGASRVVSCAGLHRGTDSALDLVGSLTNGSQTFRTSPSRPRAARTGARACRPSYRARRCRARTGRARASSTPS